ncbi:MerR family transcriptional regulator [Nocardia sp. SYP-A9097]|uniref:MerR family transcriptional regulator n=1 Tax=Nocardia sp. SYP-A9097 TaxID=2663237 RepID=UPI0013269D35|nr:MerR family transcriptional regulator [Nocardia sp. SYP-A9097]MRH87502.1 MerR family transcriptional regulator [Nocardia sp. SYP-A9097]
MESLHSGVFRTADVGRLSGYSVQQVRNLERDGVLPPAGRTGSGYRVYDRSHVLSARAYRALAAGTGPVEAKRVMRAAHSDPEGTLLAMLDAAHAQLDRERRDLESAKEAVQHIAAEPVRDVRAADSMSISELAGALGIRASTLRHWDAMGLVSPGRGTPAEARTYTPADVRSARIVHQLRLAGYGITALRDLMPELRAAGRGGDLSTGLDARDASIRARSRALLAAAAELHALRTPPPV